MSPARPVGHSALRSVARIDDTSAWAVGDRQSPQGTLIERLSEGRWRVVPSPDPVGRPPVLNGVDVVSADDAWAVGGSDLHGNEPHPLAMHWDGLSWTIVATPDWSPGGELAAVDMLSATDGWAVGSRRVASPGGGSSPRIMILRWDGTAWTLVRTPDLGHHNDGSLLSVAAISATDVFAVGASGGGGPLVVHWDGRTWKRAAAAVLQGTIGVLSDVTATEAGSVYTVGWFGLPNRRVHRILRWNGTAWTRMQLSRDPDYARLVGVTAISTTDVLAVGSRIKPPIDEGSLALTFAVHCTP